MGSFLLFSSDILATAVTSIRYTVFMYYGTLEYGMLYSNVHILMVCFVFMLKQMYM